MWTAVYGIVIDTLGEATGVPVVLTAGLGVSFAGQPVGVLDPDSDHDAAAPFRSGCRSRVRPGSGPKRRNACAAARPTSVGSTCLALWDYSGCWV